MRKFFLKLLHNAARFFQVQLFLSIVSLPITISWGLPFSTMTAIGNFFFGPFLAAFLLLSSLIFFSELLYLPNAWLIFCLEKTTELWSYCLSLSSKYWLIGFYKPSMILLIGSTISAFLIMHHKKLGRLYPSIGCLLTLFLATTTYLYYTRPGLNLFHLECGRYPITVITDKKKLTIKDNGAFSKKLSPESWAQYTLLSELIKRTGRTTIDLIEVTNPNSLTFQTLTVLCEHGHVLTIELPYFEEDLTKNGWRTYFALLRASEKSGTTIKRVSLPAL
jgi:hypothetical protein